MPLSLRYVAASVALSGVIGACGSDRREALNDGAPPQPGSYGGTRADDPGPGGGGRGGKRMGGAGGIGTEPETEEPKTEPEQQLCEPGTWNHDDDGSSPCVAFQDCAEAWSVWFDGNAERDRLCAKSSWVQSIGQSKEVALEVSEVLADGTIAFVGGQTSASQFEIIEYNLFTLSDDGEFLSALNVLTEPADRRRELFAINPTGRLAVGNRQDDQEQVWVVDMTTGQEQWRTPALEVDVDTDEDLGDTVLQWLSFSPTGALALGV